MSMERPVFGGLSPSLSVLHPASEIKGRLNFSSVKTPPLKAKKILLNDVRTPSNFNSRLGEYHMSKQNPAVIDQMYSSSASPQKDQLYKTVTPLMSCNTRLNGSGILVRNDSTPGHTSLLKQTLGKIHQNSLPGHSSLVQLAVRGSQRQYDSIGVSPVIIKLSGPEPTTSEGLKQDLGMETSSWQNDRREVVNPCDKNVVLSALKQKRKRWATSSDDGSLTDIVLPQAKRSRHGTQASSSAPSSPTGSKLLFERKRTNMAPATHFSPAPKRTRVADFLVDSLRARSMKNFRHQFTVPEIEYESDGESVGGEGVRDVREASVEPSDSASVDTRSVGSVDKERSATPPVQEEDEDVELKKRQKESLRFQKSLTAVFPSSLTRKLSSRRKLPVFCATGSKPHLPAPLSVTHSATQEDLKRDKEAAASRIKHFLSEDEEQPQKDDAPTVSSAPSATLSSSAVHTALTTTTTATNGGLQLGIPVSLTTASTDQTSAVASTVAGVASTGSSQVPTIHGSSLVCTTTTTNVPLMSTGITGLSSLSAPLTSMSSLPKSVSFALPSSATGSVTTTQSEIRMAAASTSTSSLPSQTNTQLNSKGLESSGTSTFSKGSLPSAATSVVDTNQLNPSFQFPLATTSSSSGSFTLPASTAGSQQLQQQSAVSFQFGPTAQKDLFAGVQSASGNGPQANTSSHSLAIPTASSQQTLASLFSQNATSLQTSSSNLFSGIQNGPSSGTGTSISTSVPALPVSTAPNFFSQNVTPFQTSTSSLFSGVPSNGNTANVSVPSLALPTTTSQQTLAGFFSQNTASLQTSSSNLFTGTSSNNNGTSAPTLTFPTTTSQQTFNFFSPNATPLQTSSANLFSGMKTTGANTSTSNPSFTFNLTNSPFTSQQKQGQFGQVQTGSGIFGVQNPLKTGTTAPNGLGLLQNGTNQSRSVKFNIPSTDASIVFSSGTQQQQQQQQNKSVSFFGTNAQTKPPSFNFTAGVGGLNSNQTNTGGLFSKSNGSNGFNFSANVLPNQNSAGFFNSTQQLTPAAPSTFNFTGGMNSSLQKQPPSQQQPNAFFSGVNQTPPTKAQPGLPFSQTQGNGGLFNFTTNGLAQSSGLKTSDQMVLGQQTAQNRTQNGFNFTAGAGMGVGPFNFTGGNGNPNPSFHQPPTLFGNQGNPTPGFGGFQTPQTALSFATPSNGGLNFNFGVGGSSTDSSRRARRRRGRK